MPLEADVSCLAEALRNYWVANDIGDGEYPEDARLVLGSRIKLWAAGTHEDIGSAIAHPCLDGEPRYEHAHENAHMSAAMQFMSADVVNV